jgi:hypothetical protein
MMANHWPPKDPRQNVSAGVKLRFAAGPGRTWALLAGSEAPDSLLSREPRASLATEVSAVVGPFMMLPVIR